MEALRSQTGFYGLLLVALIVIIGAIWYARIQIRKTRHQRHIHKVLEALGVKYLRDIVLPDGLEGVVFIDYLLLVPDGVVVLDINYAEGHLFGGISVDQWTQVINNKTYKFSNPLYNNETKCQAVTWNVQNNLGDDTISDDWHAHGLVVFSNAGNFPKGIPDNVSMIDELKENLEKSLAISSPVKDQNRQIWDKLHDLSITTQTEVRH